MPFRHLEDTMLLAGCHRASRHYILNQLLQERLKTLKRFGNGTLWAFCRIIIVQLEFLMSPDV